MLQRVRMVDRDSDGFDVLFLDCGHCINTPRFYGVEGESGAHCYKCERDIKETGSVHGAMLYQAWEYLNMRSMYRLARR